MATSAEDHDEGAASSVDAPVHTLADLVRTAAVRWPDRPCLATPERDLSFAEVEEGILRLSTGLRAAGGRPGHRVVVAMHKTHESFLIFHAILRIGAVVVPIDPLMPVSSARRLIDDVGPAAVIADDVTTQRFDLLADDAPRTPLGLLRIDAIALAPDEVVDQHVVEPDDPAYVIFTSGSTGVPKGITHTHRSALAYAELAVEVHGISPDDRVAGMPPLHFDMSTLELYAAPLAGATSVPIGGAELRFPASFTERSEAERLTIWYAVPFQLRMISERGAIEERDLTALRHVIYAGEPFAHDALARLMAQLPGVRFSNAYGPAETNVCTVYELERPPAGPVPIGRPWGSVRIRIVDPNAPIDGAAGLVDLDDGELGELWVDAPTMMSGYLDRPDLTAERTVVDGTNAWYRTGDLVRRDAGLLHLAGRIDHQVKVRGVRLELEAIEAVLADMPGIAHAVVAPAGGTSSAEQLVAAVVLEADAEPFDTAALRRRLLTRLPQIAVPAEVAVWDAFPLTSSGKIDRGQVRHTLDTPSSGGPEADV